MGECEFIQTCPFFHDKLETRAEEVESMKEKYCKGNNLNCARYMVVTSLGAEKMLPDLYPNEKERAYIHIAENG